MDLSTCTFPRSGTFRTTPKAASYTPRRGGLTPSEAASLRRPPYPLRSRADMTAAVTWLQHWLPCLYVRPILDLFLDSISTYPVQMQQHDQAGRSPPGLTLAGRAREWDRRALALNPFRATKPEVLCTAVSCVIASNIHACMNACMRADTDARACIGHERGIYFGSRAPRRAVTAQVNSFSSRLSDPGLRDTGPTRDSRK